MMTFRAWLRRLSPGQESRKGRIPPSTSCRKQMNCRWTTRTECRRPSQNCSRGGGAPVQPFRLGGALDRLFDARIECTRWRSAFLLCLWCSRRSWSFLYDIGHGELPGAFMVVRSILIRAADSGAVFTSQVIFILESLLGEFVYGQPLRLKSNPQLAADILVLLDMLVVAGSSAGYRMRDDFVTPLRDASA